MTAVQGKLQCFTSVRLEELNKLTTAFKSTICLLDPISSEFLKHLLPEVEEPLLNIIKWY